MKRYLLKKDQLDGIVPGIGNVRHGVPITPYSEDHEKAIKEDGRFEVVKEVEAEAEAEKAEAKKPADSGKGGK